MLVPLTPEPGLLFTVRQAGLPTHPGQISFPGGKREPADLSPEETALREAREELGLEGAQILGRLDDVPTPAGFVITPVVGLLPPSPSLRPCADEVAEVFTAPLASLRGVHRAGPQVEWLGTCYTMHEYPYGRWRIWGATAAMVRQLLQLLEGAEERGRL